MNKFYKLFWSLLSITFLVLNTCDDNPINGDNVKPGRRDYTWTVDTLFMPFNSFTDITGTSPTDVWACGPGGDLDKTFYHYDGQNWNCDFISRPISPFSIFSSTINSVWSCGLQARIWKYNGNVWSEQFNILTSIDTLVALQKIFVISEKSIYAVGQYLVSTEYWGIVLYYDGDTWNELNISKIRTAFADIEKSENGKIYLWGVTNEQFTESRYQFYELDGDILKEIYSGSQSTDAEYGSLLQLGTKTYFIIGYDFYYYNGNTFSKVGRLSDDPKFRNIAWGRSTKDIFLGMRDGIAHYNGENTVYLYQTPNNVFVRAGMVFENEVFFIGRDSYGNNLMFHGKLND